MFHSSLVESRSLLSGFWILTLSCLGSSHNWSVHIKRCPHRNKNGNIREDRAEGMARKLVLELVSLACLGLDQRTCFNSLFVISAIDHRVWRSLFSWFILKTVVSEEIRVDLSRPIWFSPRSSQSASSRSPKNILCSLDQPSRSSLDRTSVKQINTRSPKMKPNREVPRFFNDSLRIRCFSGKNTLVFYLQSVHDPRNWWNRRKPSEITQVLREI